MGPWLRRRFTASVLVSNLAGASTFMASLAARFCGGRSVSARVSAGRRAWAQGAQFAAKRTWYLETQTREAEWVLVEAFG